MNAFYRLLSFAIFATSCGMIVHASSISTGFTLHTVESFTELLIERGIVPQHLASKAREFSHMISAFELSPENTAKGLNADKVSVTVSQTIQQSQLTFRAGADVIGPLLLVKNTTPDEIILEAKRKCQIVYRVYDSSDTLVYDSSTTSQCATTERVTYPLTGNQSRMFPIKHTATAHTLTPGTYRFELEYPGYGKGSVTVTIE